MDKAVFCKKVPAERRGDLGRNTEPYKLKRNLPILADSFCYSDSDDFRSFRQGKNREHIGYIWSRFLTQPKGENRQIGCVYPYVAPPKEKSFSAGFLYYCPTLLQAATLDIQSHKISDVVPCGTVMLFVLLTVMFCGVAAK